MTSGTIAQGAIKIVLNGFSAVKNQLAQLAAQAKKLDEPFQKIGGASAGAFAAMTGGILGFLKAADPVRFTIFEQKLKILTMYIGQAFIPMLQDAINVVDRLIDYFSNLTDAQLDQIEHWVKVGLAVTGAVTALFTVYTAVSKVIGVIRALTTVVQVFMSSTGVGLVLVLAGIAFAVYEVLKATGKLDPFLEKMSALFSKLMTTGIEPLLPVLEKLGDMFAGLVDQALPVLTQFGEVASEVFAALVQAVGDFFKESAPVFKELGQAAGQLFAALLSAFKQLMPALMQIAAVFGRLYAVYASTMAKLWVGLIQAAVGVLPAITKALEVLAQVVQELSPVFADLVQVFAEVMEVVGELAGELMKLGAEVFADLVKELANLFREFWRAFGPDVINAIRNVVGFARACLAVIKEIVGAAKELVDTAKKLNPFRDRASPTGQGRTAAEDAAARRAREEEMRRQDAERGSTLGRIGKGALAGGLLAGPGGALLGGVAGGVTGRGYDEARLAEAERRAREEHRRNNPEPAAGGTANGFGWVRDVVTDAIRQSGEHQPSWLNQTTGLITNALHSVTQGGRRGPAHAPLMPVQKVEMFGIEEAFRKAQQGAVEDPSKMYERKLLEEAQKQTTGIDEIAQNTRPQVAARRV